MCCVQNDHGGAHSACCALTPQSGVLTCANSDFPADRDGDAGGKFPVPPHEVNEGAGCLVLVLDVEQHLPLSTVSWPDEVRVHSCPEPPLHTVAHSAAELKG